MVKRTRQRQPAVKSRKRIVKRNPQQVKSPMALVGNLSEVDVPSLIELARQGTGANRLRIHSQHKQFSLYVNNGEVVHAEEGTHSGVEVVYAALSCNDGTFELEKGVQAAPPTTITVPWNTLLLEGLQRLDEQRQANDSSISQREDTLMAAKEKLEDVLREMANDMEPGVRGIGVAGTDGLAIAFHKVSGDLADMLGSQMALIMQLSRRSADRMEKSDVEDVLVTTDKSYLLGRFLGDGMYFAVVNVERDSVLGNVRLAMRNYAERLFKAIPGTK
jgi:predicted regulator of Ras-like GTPase activity (Roadblock/LC7/MglB family)